METVPQRSAPELWRDYLFLTKELSKAIVRNDFPLFEEILKQREVLQTLIDDLNDSTFTQSSLGKELFQKVLQENEILQQDFHYYATAVKTKVAAANAYETGDLQSAGRHMDRQS